MGVYYGNKKLTGAGFQVDTGLSSVSQHPVANAAITEALRELGYQEWEKPADWIDIQSGVLPNSVYFLVGHSADYSTYPKFSIIAAVSSGTYDVYVDGVKFTTTASGTATELNWQTLNLATGYDVTYPSALKTHVVRVTPTNSESTFTYCRSNPISGQAELGVLWINFNVDYAISIYATLGVGTLASQTKRSRITEAVTSNTGVIKVTAAGQAFFTGASLKYVTPIDLDNRNIGFGNGFVGCVNLKTITFQNGKVNGAYVFHQATGIKKINLINAKILVDGENLSMFNGCRSLEQIPSLEITSGNTVMANFLTYAQNLQNTILDVSQATGTKKIGIFGTSTYRIDGLKGLTVSNEAPFDNENSPQLDVSYTGLNKAALVNLFKSMPYNVGYLISGEGPTVTDGILTGLTGSSTCKTTQALPDFDTFEFMTKVQDTSAGSSSYIPVAGFGTGSAPTKRILANATNGNAIRDGSTAIVSIPNESFAFISSAVSGYYLKCQCTKNENDYTYTIAASLDKETWVSESANYATNIFTDFVSFLRNSTGVSNGTPSMDFNETYIKINGVRFFGGTEVSTKTCSIVGCTGTANLTPEDKDIAEDKGWELVIE